MVDNSKEKEFFKHVRSSEHMDSQGLWQQFQDCKGSSQRKSQHQEEEVDTNSQPEQRSYMQFILAPKGKLIFL